MIDAPTLVHIVRENLELDSKHQLVAPASIRSGALSLLLAEVQAGNLDEDVALELHERLTKLKMRLLNDRVSRRTAWNIAREQGWDTLVDAEYIAICELQADAIVTIDRSFAAKASGMVQVAPLEVLAST